METETTKVRAAKEEERINLHSYGGVAVYLKIQFGSAKFHADLPDGEELSAGSQGELMEQIKNAVEKKRRQATKRKTQEPVRIYKRTERNVILSRRGIRTKTVLTACKLNGIHSRTGNPLVKIGDDRAEQLTYSTGGFIRDLTADELKEGNDLLAKIDDANEGYETWVKQKEIRDLKQYAKEQFKE